MLKLLTSEEGSSLRSSSFSRPFEVACLAVILFLSAYFRICHATLSPLSLDSARDFWIGWQIADGHLLPMSGPAQHAIFHLGPLFYYLTGLALYLNSALESPYVLVGLADTVSVFFCYAFTRRLWGPKPALLAAALYGFNLEAVFVGRYPGNPGYVHFFVMTYVWLFTRFLQNPSWKRMLASAVFLGLAIQLHTSVFFLLPLSAVIVLWKEKMRAWPYVLGATAVILVLHMPLIIHYIQHPISMNALGSTELDTNTWAWLKGYGLRLCGVLLFQCLVGFMLLPHHIAIWFQPFLALQSICYITVSTCAIYLLTRKVWNNHSAWAIVTLIGWTLIPLFAFPVYPGINHNYLDVIHPGIMILMAVAACALKPKPQKILLALLIIIAISNAILTWVFDRHINAAGFVNLYSSSTITIENLKGCDKPLTQLVPADMQLDINRKLLGLLGSPERVLQRFHGPGRLFFIDENKQFILRYLYAHGNKSLQMETRHFAAVGPGLGQGLKRGDMPLSGPFYLRHVTPCLISISNRHLSVPTWVPVDLSRYTLSIPRAVVSTGKLLIDISLPSSARMCCYNIFVSSGMNCRAPSAWLLDGDNELRPIEGKTFSPLFFRGSTLYTIPERLVTGKSEDLKILLETDQQIHLDLDIYGEECLSATSPS